MKQRICLLIVMFLITSLSFSQRYRSFLGVSIDETQNSVVSKLRSNYGGEWSEGSYHIENFYLGNVHFTDGYFYFSYGKLLKAEFNSGWIKGANNIQNKAAQIIDQYSSKYGKPQFNSNSLISWRDKYSSISISSSYNSNSGREAIIVTYSKASYDNY